MVGTLQTPPVALRQDDLCGAVATNVVEATQLAVEAVGDHDRLVEDGGWFEVAHPSQFVRPGD